MLLSEKFALPAGPGCPPPRTAHTGGGGVGADQTVLVHDFGHVFAPREGRRERSDRRGTVPDHRVCGSESPRASPPVRFSPRLGPGPVAPRHTASAARRHGLQFPIESHGRVPLLVWRPQDGCPYILLSPSARRPPPSRMTSRGAGAGRVPLSPRAPPASGRGRELGPPGPASPFRCDRRGRSIPSIGSSAGRLNAPGPSPGRHREVPAGVVRTGRTHQ